MTQGWEERDQSIIILVGRIQVPKVFNVIPISAIVDDSFAKSYNIPVYRGLPGNYSWIESGACNKQAVTEGTEKELFQ